MRLKSILILLFVIFATLLSLSACNQVAEDTITIEDTTWFLESYGEQGNLKAVLADTEITAKFESAEGQVKGSAGCNSYFGDYQIDNNTLSFSMMAHTEMYCMDPEGVMEQETEYLRLLSKAKSYEISEGKLRITAGSEILIFNAKQ